MKKRQKLLTDEQCYAFFYLACFRITLRHCL